MLPHPLPPNLPPVLPQYSDLLDNSEVGRATKLRAPKTAVLLACDVAGCGYSTSVPRKFTHHVTHVHNKLVGYRLTNGFMGFQCGEAGCTSNFVCRDMLRTHVLKDHKIENRPLLKCDVSDCPYVSRRWLSIFQHHATKHNIGKGLKLKNCDFEGCDFHTNCNTKLKIHKATAHNIGWEKLPPSLRCDKLGCNFFSSSAVSVKYHKVSVHGDVIPKKKCDYPDCQYTSMTSDDIKTHKSYRHDIDVIWSHCTEENCEYKGKSYRNLAAHMIVKHKKQRGKLAKNTAAERREERKDVNATI